MPIRGLLRDILGLIMLLSAELVATTLGILSTSIGAGIYLTGYAHDIERDEPLKELPSWGELLTWWIPKRPKEEPVYPSTALERMRAKAFAPQSKPVVGPESFDQYELRREGTRKEGKYLVSAEADPRMYPPGPPKNAWYGHLAGEPLETLIVRLVGRRHAKVVQAKVWEDRVSDGYWVSWLWEGEAGRQEMLVSRQEIAR